MPHIYLGGSRCLAPGSPASQQLAEVTRLLVEHGHSIHVGCCVGADALVIQTLLAQNASPSLFVFAAFTPAGLGAWPASAVEAVQHAAGLGASVTWSAGGPQSMPLKQRLILRSLAAMAGCAAAVFFTPGAGSFSVITHAAERNLPVYVVQPDPPKPIPSQAGRWIDTNLYNYPAWLWQPAQLGFLPAVSPFE